MLVYLALGNTKYTNMLVYFALGDAKVWRWGSIIFTIIHRTHRQYSARVLDVTVSLKLDEGMQGILLAVFS